MIAYTYWPSLLETRSGEIVTEPSWDAFFDLLEQTPPAFGGQHKHAGWSPATFEPCHRERATVVAVHALVLDYDSGVAIDAVVRVWADFYGFLHTSRSHTLEHPRFRVILPFTRSVTPEEFAPVWAWADELARAAGQAIDSAPKDPSRFWFLPARSEAPYETRRFTGAPIDPELILARPTPAPARTPPRLCIVPADQTERRASAYLARMEPAVTGKNGHAALWRAALAMVRGFGLPRAIALGLLRSDYNPRCTPPWSERELEHKVDSAEKANVTAGYLLGDTAVPPPLASLLPDDPGPAPAEVPDWRQRLRTRSDGSPQNTYGNVWLIVTEHKPWKGRWSYNEMLLTPCLDRAAVAETLPDVIRRRIETDFGFCPKLEDVRHAIGDAAAEHAFHPVREYLRRLEWDGIERLPSMARDFLGSSDSLPASMLRKTMIGAVARVMVPGCKLDTALVLVGQQGFGKSTFFEELAGEWFSDSPMDIGTKDGQMQLHSAWIYEWAEIECIVSEHRETAAKAFLSSRADTFRAPYARATAKHKRAGVIVGSTNKNHFLTDATGNRRYWVVHVVRQIDKTLLRKMRDPLWAEAVAVYDAAASCAVCKPLLPDERCDDHKWWLSAAEDESREGQSEAFKVDDSWSDAMEAWAAEHTEGFTLADIMEGALKMDALHRGKREEARATKVLRSLNYHRGDQERVRKGERVRKWTKLKPNP